jgi:hypothetical protein
MSKKKLLKDALKTLAGTLTGAAAGGGLAEGEIASNFYDNDAVKGVARLTGLGGGTLAGLLLSHPKLRKAKGMKLLALGDIGSLLGPKQLALTATDKVQNMANAMSTGSKSITDYTAIQNDLADKNVAITKNQLDTANANKEIAERANDMSKNWLELSKKALPYAGGLAALLTALYAYNTFKSNKKQPIDIKVDNKLPARDKSSMYLEIPASKVSNKFYNQFSRELLFKDDQEKYLEAKDKEEKGVNLTSKEKKIIEKFEKAASSNSSNEKSVKDTLDFSMYNTKDMDKLREQLNLGEQSLKAILDSKLVNNKRMLDYDKRLNDYKASLSKDNEPDYYKDHYFDLTKSFLRRRLPMYADANSAYLDTKDFGLATTLKYNPMYSHLDKTDKAMLFDYIKDKNTPVWEKLLKAILPVAMASGIIPTQK